MRLQGTRFKTILLALLIGALALLTYRRQKVIEETGSLRWFDRSILFVSTPVSKGITYLGGGLRRLGRRYVFLSGLEEENEALKRAWGELRAREMLYREMQKENERLLKLTGLQSGLKGEWIAARVVSFSPAGPYRVLALNRGSADGIARRAPVIAPDGLVGQVARVFPHDCQILLIVDPASAVDARLERTEARGLIVGKSFKLGLQRELFIGAFEYLNRSTEIEEGDLAVTSGLDGVYPPGIAIGYVHGAKKKQYDVFQEAEVIPAVDFFKLREVLVWKQP